MCGWPAELDKVAQRRRAASEIQAPLPVINKSNRCPWARQRSALQVEFLSFFGFVMS